MKKQTLTLPIIAVSAVFALAGCGSQSPAQIPDTQPPANTADSTDQAGSTSDEATDKEDDRPSEQSAGGSSDTTPNPYANLEDQKLASTLTGLASNATKVYSFIDIPDIDEEYYAPETIYSLYLTGDSTSTLVVTNPYSSENTTLTRYDGTYEHEGDQLIFSYSDSSGEDTYINSYTFTIDSKDRITDVTASGYSSKMAKAEGIYTCKDPELGLLTLNVSKTGTATMTYEDGTKISGFFTETDDRYDFYCYGDDDELLLDWYIDCSVNGTFKHSPYGENRVEFGGDYEVDGMLGPFTLHVDNSGKAWATINIQGEDIAFSGNAYGAYTDDGVDSSRISSVYLYAEGGYSMDLTLVDLGGEDGWNYSGTYTLPLAAG